MTNPVNNHGLGANTGIGGADGPRQPANPGFGGAGHDAGAIANLNDAVVRNPNMTPDAARGDRIVHGQAGPAAEARIEMRELPARGTDGARNVNPGRGQTTDSPPIIVPPRGGPNGRAEVMQPVINPPRFEPPPVDHDRESRPAGRNERADDPDGRTERGNPRSNNGRSEGNGRGGVDRGREHTEQNDNRGRNNRNGGPDFKFPADPKLGDYRGNGRDLLLTRDVTTQVLRRNDIFLPPTSKSSATPAAEILKPLLTAVGHEIAQLTTSPRQAGQYVSQIARQTAVTTEPIVDKIRTQLIAAGARLFSELNVAERIDLAATMLPAYLSGESGIDGLLAGRSVKELVLGLLLAHSCGLPSPNPGDVKLLAEALRTMQQNGIQSSNAAQIRDLGRLVAALVGDVVSAKTTLNLELAVRKFVRLVVANNELGTLVAVFDLAALASEARGVSRALAMVQLYELVGRLIGLAEQSLQLSESGGGEHRDLVEAAAGNARNFLEFNPHGRFDLTASEFFEPGERRHAEREMLSSNGSAIEAWLASGSHRLVLEMELARAVGVVTDRFGAVTEASLARFVLVRDGSVQGWRFLRTFLVS